VAIPSYQEYPGSTAFTNGHVSANVGHITWHARASTDPPAVVIAWLEAKLGAPERTSETSATWRFPKEDPIDVVSVDTIDAGGPHRDGTPIPANARTVIMVSAFARF
jgi:hypothetical protein